MNPFLTQLFRNLATIGVNLDGYLIDHIAYRAATLEEAESLKAEWLAKYPLLISTQVKVREVCIFSCVPALQYGTFSIPAIELLYPKPGRSFGGWDHIEVVVGQYTDSIDILRGNIARAFPDFLMESNPLYTYEEDAVHQVPGQPMNPSITIRFADKTCLRFHSMDIVSVVR